MRVAFRSVVSISFLCLALSAFSFEVRAEEPEAGQVCEILPEETPTGTGYVKCCKEVNDACSGVDAADKTTEKPEPVIITSDADIKMEAMKLIEQ